MSMSLKVLGQQARKNLSDFFDMSPLLKLLTLLSKPLFWILLALTTFVMLIELKPHAAGWIYADKIQHAFIFMVLALIGLTAYWPKKWVLLVGLILFGLAVEFLQSALTLTRQASSADWLADIVGLVIAFGLARFIKKVAKID